jgi:OPA family glycerol-3-phosphate transporter-like MFS transporter
MANDLPFSHSRSFRLRRLLNWLPMGFAYAFMYMGRYNLTVAKSALGDLMTKADFGSIFMVGAITYGCAFLINGPFIDRFGGRRGMLIGVAGSIVANALMGLVLYGVVNWQWDLAIIPTFTFLYAVNMYFQSFGAVAIVTVKAPWFHVRERGTFSTIFGTIISAGIYFAFDWGFAVVEATRAGATSDEMSGVATMLAAVFGLGQSGVDENWMIFFVPAMLMAAMWFIMAFYLKNSPGDAGFEDFETGESALSEHGERLPVKVAITKILSHPVLRFVCLIEFCSGILRNGIMHWYTFFGKEVGFYNDFVLTENWGLSLLICGLIGANATGWVSDHLFQSRRAPMCAILYGLMAIGAVGLWIGIPQVGQNEAGEWTGLWLPGMAAMVISMAVIAVHGILSGTATTDFGGTKNAGIVVGIVDGIVYLGTGLQSIVIGALAPTGEAATQASNWWMWPAFLLPFAIIGFLFTLKIWNALPDGAKQSADPPAEPDPEPSAPA